MIIESILTWVCIVNIPSDIIEINNSVTTTSTIVKPSSVLTLTKMYDDAKAMKMNSVIVQVRPFADAMYPSKYFPWSKYASGTRGKNPGYDPLAYMVNAAHARGLQFHAWVNPYRIGGEIEGGSEKYFSG